MIIDKWDYRFMDIAKSISRWSKDPNHKVGCVVLDIDRIQLAGGYNGLPRGIDDMHSRLNDRETKLMMIVHAEANAIAAAARKGTSLVGSTVYITSRPCAQCASLIIQAGIVEVVVPVNSDEGRSRKWLPNLAVAEEILKEAGVRYRRV